jgi:ribosomal protein S18 acetylase RimI-like enzyme
MATHKEQEIGGVGRPPSDPRCVATLPTIQLDGIMMKIDYKINDVVTVDEFLDVLNESGLGERRPIDDLECIAGMLQNANLVVTARIDGKLVGIARSVTDFHYACYLSDLAVSRSYQKKRIGVELQRQTQSQLGKHCKLILLAAPTATDYYPKIGYENNPNCWIVSKDRKIG